MDVNQVTILGNLGNDPEVKHFDNGGVVANISVATNRKWKDKETGETQKVTEWHRVVVKNKATVGYLEQYATKGDRLFVQGSVETRSYEKDGDTKYTTEIVVRPYGGEVKIQPSKKNSGEDTDPNTDADNDGPALDDGDDIPF